ncbi:MAG TPA: hypothetical protein VMB81_25785 [Candidatus Sulfotelmatobacter sp.]|nr:hypothetical protein [Candidatus Sulfotelmatobacter sp.]
MQKPVAKHIIKSAFRAGTYLEQILPFAKEHCDGDEYQRLLKSVAIAIHGIQDQIVEQVLLVHPDLRQEIDDSIAAYGVFI